MSIDSLSGVQADLAVRLRRLRLERCWSQARLARASGLSLGLVRRYEQSGRISAADAWDLTQALGVPVASLFGAPPTGAGRPRPKPHLH